MRPTKPTTKASLFPIGAVNQRQNREGLEYQGMITTRPMESPNVPMPIRSTLAMPITRYRVQFTRKLKFLRTYGFAPGNPVLKATPNPYTVAGQRRRQPKPHTRGGRRSGPLSVSRAPSASKPGHMGAPKRFPKALPLVPNKYQPPVYGRD
jgi:hypothetical protein